MLLVHFIIIFSVTMLNVCNTTATCTEAVDSCLEATVQQFESTDTLVYYEEDQLNNLCR